MKSAIQRERKQAGYTSAAAFVEAFNRQWRAKHGCSAEGRLSLSTYRRIEAGSEAARSVRSRIAGFLGINSTRLLTHEERGMGQKTTFRR